MKQMVKKTGNESVLIWLASSYILNEVLGFLNTMCVKFLECNQIPNETKASIIFMTMFLLVIYCYKKKGDGR
ncbi:hypothetical protein [Romboutsia sp.]|uniref:hypothetical protein n=1 Tax=Romboutsia sp. TaxID=1965302 RepID=UPI003F3EB87E